MGTSLDELEDSKVKITVEVDESTVDEAIDVAFKKMAHFRYNLLLDPKINEIKSSMSL